MMKISDRLFAVLMTVAYGVLISLISSFHEIWRDEGATMSMAFQCHSLADLLQNLQHSGHPGLWHLILFVAHKIWAHNSVLKVTHIILAMSAGYVFLRYSPFPRWQKIIFLLGLYPLYAYSVVNRNYVLNMLLVFSFCAVYPRRFEKFWLTGIILLLMANSHAHTLIVVFAILLSLGYEVFIEGGGPVDRKKLWGGFLSALAGIAVAVYQIRPSGSSVIFTGGGVSLKKIAASFIHAVALPGKNFTEVLGIESSLFVGVVIWAVAFYLLRKPNLFVFFSAGMIGLGMFFKLIYPTVHMQHEGILFLLLTAAFWLDRLTPQRHIFLPAILGKFHQSLGEHKTFIFSVFLILQMCLGIQAVKWDVMADFSVSKKAAQLIRNHPRLEGAIVIVEPDYLGESLPYYLDNPMYLLREDRFGKYIKWTGENRPVFSLDDLLTTARALRARENRPVVICLGHVLSKEGPFEIKFGFAKKFMYSQTSLENFRAQTELLASLRESIIGEEYDVFVLK